jgi:hypothetical protein
MKKRLVALFAMALMVMAIAIPASAQAAARIHLIHGIPDVAVDVYVDGAVVFPDFQYSQTQDLSSLAGQTLVALQVKAAGTDTVLIDAGDVALPGSGNYTIIAQWNAAGDEAILGVFENNVSSIAAGEGRLTVRHAAAAPPVDVLADGGIVFPNLANNPPEEASADLPVATYSVSVVPSGATEPVVIGPADIAVADGTSLIVYATGQLADGTPLPILTETITGLGETPSGVPTGNSPVDSGLPLLPLAGIAAVAIIGLGVFGIARKSN